MRETSSVLKRYTHNSIHLITPFDSGGSSAVLREAFGMLGVGDLRNRLMALADDSARGNPHVSALFSHRFSSDADESALRRELESMVVGVHPLVEAIAEPLRSLVLTHLASFDEHMSVSFSLRDACIGNLVLAGGYLAHERDIDATLYLFSNMVSVRGTVRPTAMDDVHLVAKHEGGARTVGQHLIGKPTSLGRGRIDDLELASTLDDACSVQIDADPTSLELIEGADLICFPMGSFFGSVLANLLPRGVGRAVLASGSPKVYIPNVGDDPEMHGHSISDCLAKITALVARDASREVAPHEVLDFVLVDSAHASYATELDLEQLIALGVQVIDTDLASSTADTLDPTKLVSCLLSLV